MKIFTVSYFPTAIAFAILTAVAAQADTIKLKDGKTIEGTIVSEDTSSVTIRTTIVGNIPDNKVVPRSDIASIVKKTPEDSAAEAVLKLLPTEDFLQPSHYNKLIAEGPDKFLAQFPNSKYRAEILSLKKTLTEEQAQTRRSMRKVDGKWLNGEELQANAYNIEALKIFREMEKAIAAENHRAALDAYVRLEAIGKFSLSYPKAIEAARKVLEQYGSTLAAAVKAVPTKLKNEEARLANMVPSDLAAAKAEREKVKKEFQARLAEEKKNKVRFTSTLDTDLPSLTEATRQVDTEMKRVSALNVAAITDTATRYDRVLKLIGQKKYEEALLRLDDFVKATKDAGNNAAIKTQLENVKKLKEESVRAAQQRELLNRTQARPTTAPEKPATPPEEPK
ncbi:MAG: PTPDL family protein [Verrucomicrobiales bacterium]